MIRRFASASRLTLTVATIGLAQLLGGISLLLPGWLDAPTLVGAFDTGLSDINVRLRPVLFTGNELLMVAVVPVAVLGLVWFLQRTDAGVAVRAAAEDRDRARLLAVPVARLSTIVWTDRRRARRGHRAADRPEPGHGEQPRRRARSCCCRRWPRRWWPACARCRTAFVAAVGLGVIDQLVRWHVDTKSVTTVVFLVVIVGALLLRRDVARVGTSPARRRSPAAARRRARSWAAARRCRWSAALRWSSLAAARRGGAARAGRAVDARTSSCSPPA